MVGEPTHIYTRIQTSFFLLLSIKCFRFSSAATKEKFVENFSLLQFGWVKRQQEVSHWPGMKCASAWKALSTPLQRHLSSERVTFVCLSMNNSDTRKPFKHIVFCVYKMRVEFRVSHVQVHMTNTIHRHLSHHQCHQHCRMQIANTNHVTSVTHHWIFSRPVAAEKAFGMLTNSQNYGHSICYFRVANCVDNMCDVHATKRALGFRRDTHTHILRHSSSSSFIFIFVQIVSKPICRTYRQSFVHAADSMGYEHRTWNGWSNEWNKWVANAIQKFYARIMYSSSWWAIPRHK